MSDNCEECIVCFTKFANKSDLHEHTISCHTVQELSYSLNIQKEQTRLGNALKNIRESEDFMRSNNNACNFEIATKSIGQSKTEATLCSQAEEPKKISFSVGTPQNHNLEFCNETIHSTTSPMNPSNIFRISVCTDPASQSLAADDNEELSLKMFLSADSDYNLDGLSELIDDIQLIEDEDLLDECG